MKMQKKILFILGTRPEAIKLAPLIKCMKKSGDFNVFVCNTEQQKDLSNQTLSFFNIASDFNLNVMTPNQTLAGVQVKILNGVEQLIKNQKYDAVVVQGDTMTVLCGALVAFYNKVPVFHVEAGLRSYDLQEPFPEEGIRQMVSRIAAYHFAPTEKAKQALINEGIPANKISVTGNTVIDALSCLDNDVMASAVLALRKKNIDLNDRIVLITAHRRENHGERLLKIIKAIKMLSERYDDHKFIIPVHPNPNVKNKFEKELNNISNIILTSPLSYPELVTIMSRAKLILTDSGGIQEEAPTYGVPILVLRNETERNEGIEAGVAKLVGTDDSIIFAESEKILSKTKDETRRKNIVNPYGDGKAAIKQMNIIKNF